MQMSDTRQIAASPAEVYAALLEPEVLNRDFPIMIGLTVILFAMAYSWNESGGRITRIEGIALTIAFVTYQGYVIFGVLA